MYTKGKWRVDWAERQLGVARKWLYEINDGEQEALEAQANARLIAASPRMHQFIEKLANDGDVEAQQFLQTLDL